MVYKSFNKKTESRISVNGQLAEELHKPLIKRFKRRKVFEGFKSNICAAELGEMELLFSKNKNVICLLCVTCLLDAFTKYPWVKIKKVKQFLMPLLK